MLHNSLIYLKKAPPSGAHNSAKGRVESADIQLNGEVRFQLLRAL